MRNEGRAEGKIEDILQLLEELGNVPSDLRERIMTQRRAGHAVSAVQNCRIHIPLPDSFYAFYSELFSVLYNIAYKSSSAD